MRASQSKLISREYLRVDNPEHPFTLHGPDVLLSDKKNLIALFEPNPEELKSKTKLMTRLVASKIAYPASTNMVLFLDAKQKMGFDEDTANKYFDRLIEESDLGNLKSLFKSVKNSNDLAEHKYQQRELFDLQAKKQMRNLKHLETHDFKYKRVGIFDQKIEKTHFFDNVTEKYEKPRSNIFEYKQQAIIGIKNLQKSKSDLVELEPFMDFTLRSQFKVERGIPFYGLYRSKILNINERPVNRYDPLEPIRMISLYGWQLGNFISEEELLQTAKIRK